MNSLRQRNLSAAASALIEFDAESVGQIIRAGHGHEPDIWVIDPDRYEKNGRVLRDSDSPRMVAYSRQDGILYETDGCNACSRAAEDLNSLSERNEVPAELLQYLISLL